MKKVFYIFIAIITFILGITASYFQPMAVRTVSLCEARSFDKKEVYVRAYFYFASEDEEFLADRVFLKENGCVENSSLIYSEKLKRDAKLIQLRKDLIEANKELRKTMFEEGSYSAEIEFLGEVDDLSKHGQYCLPPGLSFNVKEIKQISPIRFVSH